MILNMYYQDIEHIHHKIIENTSDVIEHVYITRYNWT